MTDDQRHPTRHLVQLVVFALIVVWCVLPWLLLIAFALAGQVAPLYP